MTRTDPRAACANEQEQFWWAAVHDLVAHPLMVLTGYSRLSLRFHDWTSHYAWPRLVAPAGAVVQLYCGSYGPVNVSTLSPGVYSVRHPTVAHALVISAGDPVEAIEKAERWFDTLAAEFGGDFNPLF